MKTPSLIVLSLMLTACGTNVNQESDAKTNSETVNVAVDTTAIDTLVTRDNNLPVSSEDITEIDKLLFIKNENILIRSSPDENADVLGEAYTEEKLIRIDSLANWFEVKAVSKEAGWEKGFVRATDVVTAEMIPFERELSEMRQEFAEWEPVVITRVTAEEFFEQKKHSVEYITRSNTAVQKENGVLRLPLKNGYKELSDQLSDTYNNYNDYYGQVDALNLYIILVTCQECEEYSWSLIDKTTGENKGELSGIPALSYDKELFCTYENVYHDYAELSFVRWDNTPELISYSEFSRWIPDEEQRGFWSRDGWFYLAILPIGNNWQLIEKINQKQSEKLRYVKIRPKIT